jgi:hypothetical protein
MSVSECFLCRQPINGRPAWLGRETWDAWSEEWQHLFPDFLADEMSSSMPFHPACREEVKQRLADDRIRAFRNAPISLSEVMVAGGKKERRLSFRLPFRRSSRFVIWRSSSRHTIREDFLHELFNVQRDLEIVDIQYRRDDDDLVFSLCSAEQNAFQCTEAQLVDRLRDLVAGYVAQEIPPSPRYW